MKTILVIDDEPVVRHLLSQALTRKGYTARTADDAEEALKLIEGTPPDLIITDHNMPGKKGVDLAKYLFNHVSYGRIPIVLLTARAFEIGEGELAETNIRHVEGKPFSTRALLARIQQLLEPNAAAA